MLLPAGGRRAAHATPVAAIADAGAQPGGSGGGAIPGEVIVRFEPGARADQREHARGSVNAQLKRHLPLDGMQLLDLPAGTSPSDAAGRLKHQAGVEYAEPNWSRHVLGSVNDTYFPYEWGLHNTGQAINGHAGTPDADIDAPEAWDVTSGDPSVTVAVVDTGIDAGHPDLSSQIVPGWDFVDGDSDPADLNGHGTHVSGTIAAAGNDASGVAGVAYRDKLMPLRVLDASGSGSVADVVSAYRYAADHHIRIINASLGSDTSSRAERDAIAAAPATLFVVAAGNGGSDGVGDDVDQSPEYPCAYTLDNIVCVAATDSSDQLAAFSNFGAISVDIAAPGVDIASDWPRSMGSYAWSDGTSMATPHVAGTAALVAARFPGATTADLRAAVLDGADHPAALATKVAGGRRLNAYGAVTAPAPAPPPPVDTTPATSPEPAPTSSSPTPEAPAPDAPPPVETAPQPAPAPLAADTTAPIVSVKVTRRARALTLRRRGLPVVISCSEACRIDARLVAGRGARSSSARSIRSLSSAGSTRLTVRPSRRALRAWARLARPGARLRLELVIRDPAGNTRRVVKTVVVAR